MAATCRQMATFAQVLVKTGGFAAGFDYVPATHRDQDDAMPRPMHRLVTLIAVGTAMTVLSGCASSGPDVTQAINDPYEAQNRKIHQFNKNRDRQIVRPVALAYSNTMPDDVEIVVSNVSDNLGLPGQVINNLLQGDLRMAGNNTLRFLINSTAGFAGIFDPSSELGLPKDDTDFGETLHVWGAGEGRYQELPFLGPSTERDTAGRIVDFAIDPMRAILPRVDRNIATGVKVTDVLGTRGRFSETVDSVLYDSADSYAQARLLYLQNRRFELGIAAPAEEEIDPFALDTEGF